MFVWAALLRCECLLDLKTFPNTNTPRLYTVLPSLILNVGQLLLLLLYLAVVAGRLVQHAVDVQ